MTASRIYLLVVVLAFASCIASKPKSSGIPEKGLYKITVLYPAGEGKTFDMDYYESKHMPMVAGYLGKNLRLYEIDKGISGRTPTDKAPYVAIGYFYCYEVGEYGKAIAANREAVLGDIKNYTNIQPVIQISQIQKVGATK